jgi:mono/diheme cytochrome c family protein
VSARGVYRPSRASFFPRLVLRVVVALALVGAVAALAVFRRQLTAAERGQRLAARTGCFACHGAEGTRGTQNLGRTDGSVPNFEGDLMMFAKSGDEIREWIRDGRTAKRAASETWREERKRGVLKMPAFKRRLSHGQIEDLVAYVEAANGLPEPEDSLAKRGLERAEALGCVGCHGPGGRLGRPNPGSLKGYVPSWGGPDFPDLVRGRQEFGEWIERGRSVRFEKNPVASFFLDRAVLKMPAYREHLDPGDVDRLWAYVEWLRSPAAAADTSGAKAPDEGE